jgi:hypothetical protein
MGILTSGMHMCTQFIWPGFRHVFGKPRRPNVQGAVERVNREIAKAIMCWIAQHASLAWTCAIAKLQYWLNQRPNTRMNGAMPFARVGTNVH